MRFSDSRSSRWLPGFAVVCSLSTIMIYGCGGGSALPKGEQASVSGTVKFEGNPVALNSTVVFYSKETDATAAGTIDAAGKFTLKGAQPKIGIPVGQYVVMVRPPEPAMTTSVAAGPGSPDYQKKMMEGAAAKPEAPKDIPAAFLSLDKSTLKLELKSGPNSFDIDLAKVGK